MDKSNVVKTGAVIVGLGVTAYIISSALPYIIVGGIIYGGYKGLKYLKEKKGD